MKKNIFAILLLVAATLITIIGVYYFNSTKILKFPISTGGDKPQQVPANINSEPDAMAKLAKLLPLKTANFSIVFDYKLGKYVVTKTGNTNLQSDFDKWYAQSEFKAIAKNRFTLVQ